MIDKAIKAYLAQQQPADYTDAKRAEALELVNRQVKIWQDGLNKATEKDRREWPNDVKHLEEMLAVWQYIRAALLQPLAVPEGMVLVPIEPTEEMIRYGGYAMRNGRNAEYIYKAMLQLQGRPPTSIDGADLTRSEDVLNNQGKLNMNVADNG